MGAVIGDVLIFGLGIVIGPIPIIAVILLLAGRRGQTNGFAYLIGWVIGLTLLVASVVWLVQGLDFSRQESTPSLMLSWGRVLAGIALLILAYVTWRRRSSDKAKGELPAWLSRIHLAAPVMALATGLFFGLISPKNLLFVAAAAAAIGRAQLPLLQALLAGLLFIAIATSGIAMPVYIAWAKQERAQAILDDWVRWLSANNALIVSLLCVLLGVKLIGDGLGGLLVSAS